MNFEGACEEAQRISAKENCVQHVNRTKANHYYVSDWYDEDCTFATYEYGHLIYEV